MNYCVCNLLCEVMYSSTFVTQLLTNQKQRVDFDSCTFIFYVKK